MFLCTPLLGYTNAETDSLSLLLTQTTDPGQRSDLLRTLAKKLTLRYPDSALTVARDAYALAKGNNDLIGAANAQLQEGIALRSLGRYDEAIAVHNSTLTTINLQSVLAAKVRKNLGLAYRKNGQLLEASQEFDQALEVADQAKDSLVMANILNNMGNLNNALGYSERALLYLFRAEQLYSTLGEENKRIQTLNNLGNHYVQRTLYAEADSCYTTCLNHYQSTNDSIGLGRTLNNLGHTRLMMGQMASSAEALTNAQLINEQFGNMRSLAVSHSLLAGLSAEQDNQPEALEHYQNALSIYEEMGRPVKKAGTLSNIGVTLLNLDRAGEAVDYFEQALALYKSSGAVASIPVVLENLGESHAQLGQSQQAWTYAQRALQWRDSLNMLNNQETTQRMKVLIQAEEWENQWLKEKQESALKEVKNNKQQAIWVAITSVLLLALVSITFAWRYQRLKRNRDRLVHETAQLERKRIGSELHDNMGAVFMQIGLYFERIEERINANFPDLKDTVGKTNALLSKAANMVRQVSHDLHSNTLAREGLAAALQELQDSVNQSSEVEMSTLAIGLEDKIPNHLALTIHQSIRELVNNAMKHANPTTIEVVLVHRDEGIEVRVEDDGEGINRNAEAFRNGIGLNNIRTRLKKINGTFALQTSDKGTIITLLIPKPT